MAVVNFASTFTIDEIPKLVGEKWGNVELDAGLAQFSQVYQSLLDASSLFYNTAPGALNVALVRLGDLKAVAEKQVGGSNPGSELAAACQTYHAASTAKAPLTLLLCPEEPSSDAAAKTGEWATALREGIRGCSKIILVSLLIETESSPMLSGGNADDYFDPVSEKLGAMPYTKKGYDLLAYVTARALSYVARPPTKVVVCDCDNTLWAGQVGDSESAPKEVEGNLALMGRLKRRKEDGDLLLITASKNTEVDVKAAFDAHPEWPLSFSDFVLHKVNWEPKSGNMQAAATELNLTLDYSWVFLDDNPVEIAEVQANAPSVLAINVPAFRAEVVGEGKVKRNQTAAAFAANLWPLDCFRDVAASESKTEQYRTEFARQSTQVAATSFTDFIRSLELKISVSKCQPADEPRVLQLTQKSNQFNFTTKRHLTMPSDLDCSVVRVSDRFGDYGLVGIMFYNTTSASAHSKNKVLVVDNFVMSCRVLGRGVEHAMLQHLGELAGSGGTIKIEYRDSGKNMPARKFLQGVELMPVEEDQDSASWEGTFTDEQVKKVAVFDPENVNTYGASVNDGGSKRQEGSGGPGGASSSTGGAAGRARSFAAVDIASVIQRRVDEEVRESSRGTSAGSAGTRGESASREIDSDLLTTAIIDAVATILGEDPVGTILRAPGGGTRSLTTLGMDSLLAVRCLGEVARTVKKRIGHKIDLVSKVDKYQRNPQVQDWAELIATTIRDSREEEGEEEFQQGAIVSKFPHAVVPTDATGKTLPIVRKPLESEGVMFQVQKGTKGDVQAPMVFIHPAGGATRPFHKLWKGLGLERDLWAVEHPFMTNIDYDPRTMTVGELGSLYSKAIIEKLGLDKKDRKWVLCSYSAGGLYLNETYHQLRMAGYRPALVLGLDFIHKPLPHCPLMCPSQPCYFPQVCGCCWQCFGLQELCVLANMAAVWPCMKCIFNGRNHDRPGVMEKMPPSYNNKISGYMMPGFMQNGPLLEGAYDFFRMGFEDTVVIKDKAPVQQTMKEHREAKTWDQKVEAVRLRLDEKLKEDGMDEDQRNMITTKWERSANVYIHNTAPNLLCCIFTPVSYGNTPVADFEIGRNGPAGCCAKRPMRGWEMLNAGGVADGFKWYGNYPVNAINSATFKQVFPSDPPHFRAHQLVLLDEEWLAWALPKIKQCFEDLKIDEP
ncbi:unnamed protein product [Amoebophrya sp. A25]|nr:unnamed protein product [Amoebophrya sp. A25]|eukprot:GSA25T00020811001.1